MIPTTKRTSAAIVMFLAALMGAAVAGPAWADDGDSTPDTVTERPSDHAPGELIVRFDTAHASSRARSGRRATLAGIGGRTAATYEHVESGLHRVVLDEGVDVEDAAAALNARDDVVYAEPNYRIHAAGTPNDSRFGEQYGMHNTGQTVKGVAGTADADIDAPEAWNVTTGSANVVVAVMDTGVAYDHPDLAPNMWVNTEEIAGNGIDDDGNGYVDDRRGWDAVDGDNDPVDENGHGTHVAGIIGARGNNDAPGGGTTDVTGVAWKVRLMPVRVLNEVGVGTIAGLLDGIDYAKANGARIANLSLSTWNYSAAMQDAIEGASNITFVVAAGNDSNELVDATVNYPCSLPSANVVCVAATDNRDRLASFSNWSSSEVDVAAPGVNVLSTKAYTTLFSDSFETTNAKWTFGGTPNTWARTKNLPLGLEHAGTWLTDSPAGDYTTGTDNWARTSALDLTGMRHCTVQFHAYVQVESWFGDFVAVEVANSPNGPWVQAGTGFNGFAEADFDQRIPDEFSGDAQAYVRIHLHEDGQFDTGDGVFVDDFSVECAGRATAASYEYLSGTSMATPHVAGVAALVLAKNPGFTSGQIKGRLLTSVDKKASLTGKVLSGGRINAMKAVRATVPNQLPVAQAGADRPVKPGSTVSLAGSGSDPDGQKLTYSWKQLWGTPVTVRNAATPTASFTAARSTGTMRFRLTVTDPQGAIAVDDVDITVSAG
ncbi:MAG: S8 family serine peptidase [Acidimicrobiia bacterium]|nr:S8 family serine peptidase [Acidimicrobiia bacterium]